MRQRQPVELWAKAIDATVSATRHIESLAGEEADEVWREHRRRSNEASVEMGRRFKEARAEKSEGEELEPSIQCELFAHQLGWELRLLINGELRMSQLCRAQNDILDVREQVEIGIAPQGMERRGYSCRSLNQISKVQADVTPETIVLKKVCSVNGCTGIMHFHDRRETAFGDHTLEWPWYATWVCSKEPAHIQILAEQEYQEIRRLLERRESAERIQLPYLDPTPKRRGLLRRAAHRIATLFGSLLK